MDSIHIVITQEDIDVARSYQLPPLLFVLVRTTGTLWRISHCGVAVELIAPHRTFALPPSALRQWQSYDRTGVVTPHEFSVESRALRRDASWATAA